MIVTCKYFWGEDPKGNDQQGHIINDFHFERVKKLMETSGGEIIYGGQTYAPNKHIQPTMIMNPKDDSPIMNEEIFGPVLPIKVYKDIDDVICYINDREKALVVYFMGNANHADSKKVQDRTSSGEYSTNECLSHILSHYTGFGGVGESGTGRY
jgi:aldehyde dehydrogenase (NAD+)